MIYAVLLLLIAALAASVLRRTHRAAAAGLGTGRYAKPPPRTVDEHADDLTGRYPAPFDPAHPWADPTTRRVRRRA